MSEENANYRVKIRIVKVYEFDVESKSLKSSLVGGIEAAELAEADGSIEPVSLDIQSSSRFVSDVEDDEEPESKQT